MTSPLDQPIRTSRRIVFHGLGAIGVAVALAGCGGGDDSGGGGAAPEAGASLAKTADIPVGGGVVLPDANIVITQPTEGDFKAFSAVCTHQGCAVNEVTAGEIICPCHASKFSVEDGAVTAGPAPSPLPEKQITVNGTSIVLA